MLKKVSFIIGLSLFISACSQEKEATVNQEELKQAVDVVLSEDEASPSESDKANAMYDRFFEESVARSPESLTFLGRKDRADEWDDLSAEFQQEGLEAKQATARRIANHRLFQTRCANGIKLRPAQTGTGREHRRFSLESLQLPSQSNVWYPLWGGFSFDQSTSYRQYQRCGKLYRALERSG